MKNHHVREGDTELEFQHWDGSPLVDLSILAVERVEMTLARYDLVELRDYLNDVIESMPE